MVNPVANAGSGKRIIGIGLLGGGKAMRVHLGDPVRSQDGQDLGAIKHLVLDPNNGYVKCVVIEKGHVLVDDVEMPLNALARWQDGAVFVGYTEDEVKAMPRFNAQQYEPLPPDYFEPEARYGYGGVIWPMTNSFPPFTAGGYPLAAPWLPVLAGPLSPRNEKSRTAIDRNNAVIEAGDDVISADGHNVGEVHTLTFDTDNGKPLSLVVRRGILFHEDIALPAQTIASVDDGVVFLNVERAHIAEQRE
jgi:uncharacterized protein YrrD